MLVAECESLTHSLEVGEVGIKAPNGCMSNQKSKCFAFRTTDIKQLAASVLPGSKRISETTKYSSCIIFGKRIITKLQQNEVKLRIYNGQ